MPQSSERQIENLLSSYAHFIDSGQLEKAAELFTHATLENPLGTFDSAGILQVWRDWMVLYPDGTPRTRHVTTNTIIDVNESADFATSQCYYTVFQQTDDFPLQPICAGYYQDQFRREEGIWFFTRRHDFLQMIGDISRHGQETMRARLGI